MGEDDSALSDSDRLSLKLIGPFCKDACDFNLNKWYKSKNQLHLVGHLSLPSV